MSTIKKISGEGWMGVGALAIGIIVIIVASIPNMALHTITFSVLFGGILIARFAQLLKR